MSYSHFTSDERLQISILLKKGFYQKDIAHALKKNPSSLSREIAYRSVRGTYDPQKAQQKAYVKRLRSKYAGMKVVSSPALHSFVRSRMKLFWTPEQIAGRWNRFHARHHNGLKITVVSIYTYLYSPYGRSLCQYLPSKRCKKKKRCGKKSKHQTIKNRVFLDQRPPIINARKRFGDFEADTLGRIKSDDEVIAGMVERQSRYFFVTKVARLKNAMDGFKDMLNPHHNIVHSMTMDNGVENARYQELNTDTYFCHPYSSWEKGAIENIFQRFRRFVPKKSSLTEYVDEDIERFGRIMNDTPRKCLNYRTPLEVFSKKCQKARNN
jgi:transposase, IS30 family